jgi:hypothetical protein
MPFHAFVRENCDMFFIDGDLPEAEAIAYAKSNKAVMYIGLVEVMVKLIKEPSAPEVL